MTVSTLDKIDAAINSFVFSKLSIIFLKLLLIVTFLGIVGILSLGVLSNFL